MTFRVGSPEPQYRVGGWQCWTSRDGDSPRSWPRSPPRRWWSSSPPPRDTPLLQGLTGESRRGLKWLYQVSATEVRTGMRSMINPSYRKRFESNLRKTFIKIICCSEVSSDLHPTTEVPLGLNNPHLQRYTSVVGQAQRTGSILLRALLVFHWKQRSRDHEFECWFSCLLCE